MERRGGESRYFFIPCKKTRREEGKETLIKLMKQHISVAFSFLSRSHPTGLGWVAFVGLGICTNTNNTTNDDKGSIRIVSKEKQSEEINIHKRSAYVRTYAVQCTAESKASSSHFWLNGTTLALRQNVKDSRLIVSSFLYSFFFFSFSVPTAKSWAKWCDLEGKKGKKTFPFPPLFWMAYDTEAYGDCLAPGI